MRVKRSFRELAIATTNQRKAAAMMRVASCCDLGAAVLVEPRVDESGPAFVDNASAKATAASRSRPGALVLGSDGGLTIPALGRRWDPLSTSRFAPGDPWEKALALLELMSGLRAESRAAFWSEALAVAGNGVLLASWTVRGPLCVVRTQVPAHVDSFWVDALLERRGSGPDHWQQLEVRFTSWWRA